MTAASAVYVWCPDCLAGRAEIDPSNPDEEVQCNDSGGTNCDWTWTPSPETVRRALESRGYSYSDRHGWRTDADIQDDSWNCECEDCHPGVERRGRWE